MSFLRKKTKAGFTTMNNELLDAEGISFRAKGIAAFLLSKPDNWIVRIEHLMKVGKEGEQAIRTALHELATYGFLSRERTHDSNGHLRTITHIADYPAFAQFGTPRSRILGYDASVTDLAETEMAVSGMSVDTDLALSDMSVSRTSGNREVFISTDLVNTDKESGIISSSGPSGRPEVDFMPATHPIQHLPYPPPKPPPLPRPTDGPWAIAVAELSRTLPSGFVPMLQESRLELIGEIDGEDGKPAPLYHVYVPAARAASVPHFVRQAGTEIQKRFSSILGKRVYVEIVVAEPEPTP